MIFGPFGVEPENQPFPLLFEYIFNTGVIPVLIILSENRTLLKSAQAMLSGMGWGCVAVGRIADLLLAVTEHCPAVILIDGGSPDAAAAIGAVRELPTPARGTPIVTVGKALELLAAVAGHLDLPLEPQALREMLEQWAGPIDDHALRAVPFSPRYRLIRLVGFAAAEGMLRRFEAELAAAVACAETDPAQVPAHRLAGVAGLVGYEDLGALWAEAEKGGEKELARAVAASRKVLLRR